MEAPCFLVRGTSRRDASSLHLLAESVRGFFCREEDNKRLGLPIGMEGAHGDVRQAPLAVACWKGQFTVNVLLGKADCAASLDRLMGHIKKHGTKEEAQELQPIIEGTKDDGGEAQDQAGEAAEAKAGDIKAE